MIGALRYFAARMFAPRYWPKTGPIRYTLSADPGAYGLMGAEAGLTREVVVSADPGAYIWSGVPAALIDPSTPGEAPNNWHEWAETSVQQNTPERTKREQKW